MQTNNSRPWSEDRMTTAFTIYAIDDEQDDFALLCMACQSLGLAYDLRYHDSGEAGLIALQQAAADGRIPDLVLLDMDMPGLAGYEVLRQIRADPRLGALTVVMLTGSLAPEDRAVCAIANHYVAKPQDLAGWKQVARQLATYAPYGTQATRARDHHAIAAEPHILHIDDDADDRDLFALAFGKSGLRGILHGLAGATDALLYLNQLGPHTDAVKPRLIILDLSLPRVDGRELLELLRINPRFKTIPVIVLTGSENYADMQRCRELGVDDYVVKPQSAQQLIELIASFQHWLADAPNGSPVP
jgi:CheY-like chemotaxis protein